jgi:hypothetical protein
LAGTFIAALRRPPDKVMVAAFPDKQNVSFGQTC